MNELHQSEQATRIWLGWFLLFLLVAAVVSFPRFGQFENEHAPHLSDSAFYEEMAQVFMGDSEGFTGEWVSNWPHHFNRPLFPWLAGRVHRFLPGISLRASFSLINLLAAAAIAMMFKQGIEQNVPSWRFSWLPPLLFLTGFPQLNWGYHLLTDTLGLATAMMAFFYVLRTFERMPSSFLVRLLNLLAVFVFSALSFLTRETGWFAVIGAGWCLLVSLRKRSRSELVWCSGVLLVLILGKIPHSLYEAHFQLSTPTLRPETLFAYNPVYWLDVFVKTGVAFHFAWFPALLAAVRMIVARKGVLPPVWIVGWTLAALAYNAAVYVHNDITFIGYPMRVSFTVFPLIYFYVEAFFEKLSPHKRPHLLAALFVVFNLAVGWLGVLLDPGVPGVTVRVILQDVFGISI
jgi:hypothetical protein